MDFIDDAPRGHGPDPPARRRGPRRPRLPPHDVRVGAAPDRAGRTGASSSATAPWSTSSRGRRRRRRRRRGSTGVVLDDGTDASTADLVVAAGGRRADVPALLAPHRRRRSPRRSRTPGSSTCSRFFRCVDGADYPPQVGPDRRRPRLPQVRACSRATTAPSRSPSPSRTDDDELRRTLARPRRLPRRRRGAAGHRGLRRAGPRRPDHRGRT